MRVKLNRDQLDILIKKSKAYSKICGVDEVGKGPIAGPVVSCAVVMGGNHIEGVKDSKKLSDKKRRELAKDIYSNAIAIGYGIVEHDVIDKINIRQASLLAMTEAIKNLSDKQGNNFKADLALIDAELIEYDIDQIGIISGDDLVYEISCASILAKIFRDDIMIEYSKKYPEYMFEAHKGYGTKKHYKAIDNHGLTEIHRITFMKKYYEQQYKNDRETR